MSTIINRIPLELLELICDELDTRDLASLVGTCRDTYYRTINRLAQRYTEIHLDFSQDSFNHIHAIANNKVMREQVHRLVVMTPEPYLGRNLQWQRSAAGHIQNPLQIPVIQRFRNDLVERLTNCRSFVISPVRTKFVPEEEDDTNNNEHFNPDDAAGILLEIIADTSLPMKLFWYGTGVNYTSNIMDIQRLPKDLFTNPAFRAGWGRLENLHLDHKLTPYNYSFILNMILHAPSLRKVYLSLAPRDLAIEFFSQLAQSQSLPSSLERIALCFTSIRAVDLVKILSHSRQTLRRLILDDIGGLSSDASKLHSELQGCFPRLEAIDFNKCH
ncbi:hypothetical protein ANOM_008108 [Aspergillus nomiae NRRL 13137]|uniref:F-box domain-containing protein n=1 Tax=Aspergillus nomiae NRRL (strain ATCC 15546 / NRRL 13137 / CBS 260.88 / M93) TaxID=1509407 RepID=A0A0L1IYK7_ASPN3|nr:uncharacterized protein ANOM_008108 [Aspergillus nomiae NRRL 13137]KNG84589.1 hypothetical protein ANOM_008108 [Aspergillus nomiae NRRL 13137]